MELKELAMRQQEVSNTAWVSCEFFPRVNSNVWYFLKSESSLL